MKYARKCSITGEGMNEGFVYCDGDMYFAHKQDLIVKLRDAYSKEISKDFVSELSDDDLLDLSYEDNTHYYTEWEDEDDYQYEMIDGELVEIQ